MIQAAQVRLMKALNKSGKSKQMFEKSMNEKLKSRNQDILKLREIKNWKIIKPTRAILNPSRVIVTTISSHIHTSSAVCLEGEECDEGKDFCVSISITYKIRLRIVLQFKNV